MSHIIKDSLKVIILSMVVSLSVYLVLAQGGWVEPTAAPPGGNVATPLNTGSAGQSKSGGLILNTGGAANGLIVSSGNVGIGTTNPGARLQVDGTLPNVFRVNGESVSRPVSVCAFSATGVAAATCPAGKTIIWAHYYSKNVCDIQQETVLNVAFQGPCIGASSCAAPVSGNTGMVILCM